jgi:hypothetical protein
MWALAYTSAALCGVGCYLLLELLLPRRKS